MTVQIWVTEKDFYSVLNVAATSTGTSATAGAWRGIIRLVRVLERRCFGCFQNMELMSDEMVVCLICTHVVTWATQVNSSYSFTFHARVPCSQNRIHSTRFALCRDRRRAISILKIYNNNTPQKLEYRDTYSESDVTGNTTIRARGAGANRNHILHTVLVVVFAHVD